MKNWLHIEMTERRRARFWRQVDRRGPDECWPWLGTIDRLGYGRFAIDVVPMIASRVMWVVTNDCQPAGLVCHKCDNPPCVNPAHLWLGTSADNTHDMIAKGRARGQDRTHCIHGHEYTPENTYWRPGTIAGRDCRACVRDRVARYNQRKAAA